MLAVLAEDAQRAPGLLVQGGGFLRGPRPGNFHFKILVYAPGFQFCTFPLDYFQDHFSNKPGNMPLSPSPPQFKTCCSGGLAVWCGNGCGHEKSSRRFLPPYPTGERTAGCFLYGAGWAGVRGRQGGASFSRRPSAECCNRKQRKSDWGVLAKGPVKGNRSVFGPGSSTLP